MSKLLIKKGDTVVVLSGKDKGKTGKVTQAFPQLNRVVVEGVNACKRHLRSRRSGDKGQVVEFFMPINACKVALMDAAGKRLRHDDRPSA